jgi:hypothetical protein
MAVTDSPLKRLVSTFITDFAAWLLKAEVHEARVLNVELPAETLEVDQVFRVILYDGREVLLHIEFQGRRSDVPMRWRMLEYIARLAATYRLELLSVVFYVGRGAGAQDPGRHQVQSPTGTVTISWQYEVIRLWQMPAEEFLRLDRPALLALVGQMQIGQPEVVLPAVVTRLCQEPDGERRQQLLTGFLALLPAEEWIRMVERLLEEDWLIDESPFLQRLLKERALATRRDDILEVLVVRFAASGAVYDRVAQRLATLTDEAQLSGLHRTALQSAQLADFLAILEGMGHA